MAGGDRRALWIEWYSTKLTLGVGGARAAGLALLAVIQAMPGGAM